jgi:hypothetical protein
MDLKEWYLAVIAYLLGGIALQIGGSGNVLFGLSVYAIMFFSVWFAVGWPIVSHFSNK